MKFTQYLIMLLFSLCVSSVEAALSCTTPTTTGFSTAYSPLGVVPNSTQGLVTFNCTRTAAGDATSVLLRATNGANATGAQNNARIGGNRIQYEAYKDSGCTALWSNNNTIANMITVPLTNVIGTQSLSVNFWGCITLAGQTVPAGNYPDTIGVRVRTLANGNVTGSGNVNMAVTITNPATCAITSVGNVAFGTYVAFRNTNLIAPAATITLNCTQNLPYTMALDETSGVVVGLNYTLALSATNSRGTGPGQTHTITGTMPANQAGTCATAGCAGTQQRTLTITY